MKKTILLFWVIFALSTRAMGQEYYCSEVEFEFKTTGFYAGYIGRLRFFENNKITMVDAKTNINLSGNYVLYNDNGIDFLIILFDNNTWKKYLVLFDKEENNSEDYCYFHDLENPGVYLYYGKRLSFIDDSYIPEDTYTPNKIIPKNISATSSLVEGSNTYAPNNINLDIDSAWAEGAEGQGIGEKLIISKDELSLVFGFGISIGYVSYTKPYLYQYNSRPKTIQLRSGRSSIILHLNDTPHFQFMRFPNDFNFQEDLEIEILEVYPGSRYADTCINSLYLMWSQ
jgi:hypothetical protein